MLIVCDVLDVYVPVTLTSSVLLSPSSKYPVMLTFAPPAVIFTVPTML